MNFLFKLIICLPFLTLLNVSAHTLVDEELKDYFSGEVVKGDFNKTILKETLLSEYGKNVVFNDACVVSDGYIVVGGSVRMGEALGGMDALVVKYKGDEIQWFKVFGGVNKDVFTSVNCDKDIVISGETYIDNFKSGLMVSLDILGNLNWEKRYKTKLDVTLTSLDYNNDYYFTGYVNSFNTDNDFLILKVNETGEILEDKVFINSKDDRINDILIDDFIYLVGSTDSNEFDLLSQRGILLKLDNNLDVIDTVIYNSSEISLFNNIDVIDGEIYITGAINKNEALEFSNGMGFIAKVNDQIEVMLKDNFTEVNGVYKLNDMLIPYGVKFKKEYIPIINYKEEVTLLGKGEVIKIINSNGLKAIHTNIESTNIGVITNLTNVKKINDKIYINNIEMNLEERYIDEYSNSFGEYKKYSYFKFNDIEYYGNLVNEKIDFYTNIDKEEYYDNVTLYFNGTGFLNGVLIDSGYTVKELGEYELKVIGNNTEQIRNFVLKTRKVNLNFYDNYNYKENSEETEISFNEEKNYSIYIGILVLIIFSVLWYLKRKN